MFGRRAIRCLSDGRHVNWPEGHTIVAVLAKFDALRASIAVEWEPPTFRFRRKQ
ncbi:MAG: hypothetical protein ACTS6A_02900 [Candidatus Hodgkinia cicadicola]